MIKQLKKFGENFYPQTSTTAVVDEATGKKLSDVLILQGYGTRFLSDDGTYKEIQVNSESGSEVTVIPCIDLGLITGDSFELQPPYPEGSKDEIISMLTSLWGYKNDPLIHISYQWGVKNGPEDEIVKISGIATHEATTIDGKERHIWKLTAVPFDYGDDNPNYKYVYNFELSFPGDITEIMAIILAGGFKSSDYMMIKRTPFGQDGYLTNIIDKTFTALTFEAVEDDTYLDFIPADDNDIYKLEFKFNDGDWMSAEEIDENLGFLMIDTGETISIRSHLVPKESVGIGTFSATKPVKCYGSPMSLLYGKDAYKYDTVPAWGFANLFKDFTNLLTAPELPAKTVGSLGYYHMFSGCTSLTEAPILPAYNLGEFCYGFMFENCTSLTKPPILPAFTLSTNCYNEMFKGCTALIYPPIIRATTLAPNCCFGMFLDCTSLQSTPKLKATKLAESCYSFMFQNCTSLQNVYELPASTLEKNCYSAMFIGCTGLEEAPLLPANNLVEGCYNYMFNGCSNLKYIKALFITPQISPAATMDWVTGVSKTGTFVKYTHSEYSDTLWGSYFIPYGWTVEKAVK